MSLGNRIRKENILIDLKSSTKEETIKVMAEKLYENGYLENLDNFIESVFKRESQMTTGVGNNLAIPHGKSKSVIESTVAVAKLESPVDWQSLDDEPVEFVFLLAIRDVDKGDEHIRILADLSGKLMDDEFVENIKNSKDINDLEKALVL